MNHYHVYGVGNAIIDMEFGVDDDFLVAQGIKKGHMTLVDSGYQQNLLTTLGTHPKMFCGGSAANSMITLSGLGGHSFYACRVADDNAGHFFAQSLRAAGVDSSLQSAKLQNSGMTATSLIFITPDAERSMNTCLGVSEFLNIENIDEKPISQSMWIYLEGYLATSKTGSAAAIHAREIGRKHGAKLALTLSDCNIIAYHRPALQAMAGSGLELLFCNEEEALAWTDTRHLDAAGEALLSVTRTFAITRGALGVRCFDGQRFFDAPAIPATSVVNTNGAGDTFAGAFLYSLAQSDDYEAAANLAIRASSLVIVQAGARLSAEQLQGLAD